ncbi:Lrp/AsnC family transcriptional regulator [Nonomuraea cavernae]|uniref:Lrp/AsnC family transcriptional regulator n=1 Tax=Nonomuraea cavernae TaxID=2045107 RepID=UPI0033C179F5
MTIEVALDLIDRQILRELHEDARLSVAGLARRVSLSRPAVADRLRRLEDTGVITGYGVRVDAAKLGFELQAIVRVRTHDPSGNALDRMLSQIPEVVECRHVTGEDCYVLTVWARSMAELERVCTHLATAGRTTTTLIFSTRIHDRIPLGPEV